MLDCRPLSFGLGIPPYFKTCGKTCALGTRSTPRAIVKNRPPPGRTAGEGPCFRPGPTNPAAAAAARFDQAGRGRCFRRLPRPVMMFDLPASTAPRKRIADRPGGGRVAARDRACRAAGGVATAAAGDGCRAADATDATAAAKAAKAATPAAPRRARVAIADGESGLGRRGDGGARRAARECLRRGARAQSCWRELVGPGDVRELNRRGHDDGTDQHVRQKRQAQRARLRGRCARLRHAGRPAAWLCSWGRRHTESIGRHGCPPCEFNRGAARCATCPHANRCGTC